MGLIIGNALERVRHADSAAQGPDNAQLDACRSSDPSPPQAQHVDIFIIRAKSSIDNVIAIREHFFDNARDL